MTDQPTLRAIIDHFEQRAAREAETEPCGEPPAAEQAAQIADDAAWLEPLFTHPDRHEALATIERLLAIDPRREFDFHHGEWRGQVWKALVERHATSDETMAVATRLAALGGDARHEELSTVLFRWSHLKGATALLLSLARDTRSTMASRRGALGSLVSAHRLPPAERRAALLTLAEDEDAVPELRLRAVKTLWKDGDVDERTQAATLDLLRRSPEAIDRYDLEDIAGRLPKNDAGRSLALTMLDLCAGRDIVPVAALDRLLVDDPSSAPALRRVGERAGTAGDRADAIAHLAFHFPGDPETLPWLLRRLDAAETPEERRCIVAWLVLRFPGRPGVIEAIVAATRRRSDEAEALLLTAVAPPVDLSEPHGSNRHSRGMLVERELSDLRDGPAKCTNLPLLFANPTFRARLIEVWRASRDHDFREAISLRVFVHRRDPAWALRKTLRRVVEVPRPDVTTDVLAEIRRETGDNAFLQAMIDANERILREAAREPEYRFETSVIEPEPAEIEAWARLLAELDSAMAPPKPARPAARATPPASPPKPAEKPGTDLPSLLKAFEAADRWDPTDPPRRLRRLLEHPDHEAVRETLERLLIERPCDRPSGPPDEWDHGPWGWRAVAWGDLIARRWRVEQVIAFVDRRAARLDGANIDAGERQRGVLEMATLLARAYPGDAAVIAALARWFETPWVGDTILWTIWEASGACAATVPSIAVGLASEKAGVRSEAVLLARRLAGEFPDLRREAEAVARAHPDDLGTAPDRLRRWLSEAPTDEETERTLDRLAEVAATGGFTNEGLAAELLIARALRIDPTPRDLERALAAAESRRPQVRRTGLDLLAWFHSGHPRTLPLLLDELAEGRDVAARVAAFRALLIVYGDHAEIRATLRAAMTSERSDDATARMRRLFDGDVIERFFELAGRDPALEDLRRAEAERLTDVTTRHGLSTRERADAGRRSWWDTLWGKNGGR